MLVGMAERGARQGLVDQPGRKAADKPVADKPVADRIAVDYSPAAGCRLAVGCRLAAVADKPAVAHKHAGGQQPLLALVGDVQPLPVGVLLPLLVLVGDVLPLPALAEDERPLPVPVVCERPLQLRGRAVVGLLVLQSSVRNRGRTYSRC